jgi:hypothetical protein
MTVLGCGNSSSESPVRSITGPHEIPSLVRTVTEPGEISSSVRSIISSGVGGPSPLIALTMLEEPERSVKKLESFSMSLFAPEVWPAKKW